MQGLTEVLTFYSIVDKRILLSTFIQGRMVS